MSDLYTQVVGPRDAEISLIFMHGPGWDHAYFRPFVDPLADAYQLIFYDARLSGQSVRRTDRPIDPDLLAEDVRQVAVEHASGAVVLVAHSWAPVVALHAARRFALQSGLILVTPGLSPTVPQTLLRYFDAHGNADQRAVLAAAFAGQILTDAQLEQAWRTILPAYFAQYDERAGHRLCANTRFSAAAFNSFAANVAGRFDWRDAVSTLHTPMLVLAGAHDWIETDPAGGSRAVADASALSAFHVFPNSGHLPFVEEPDAFVRTVRNWLVEHRDAITARP